MTARRLPDYLAHMRQAITDALSFTEGMAQPDFEQDKRTQQAVVMTRLFRHRPRRGLGHFANGIAHAKGSARYHRFRIAARSGDIINRFGRYPHRNAILGRESSPEELTFLSEPGSGF